VDRSGKFLYASNRGNDTIAVFAISPRKGTLTPIEYAPCRGKYRGCLHLIPVATIYSSPTRVPTMSLSSESIKKPDG